MSTIKTWQERAPATGNEMSWQPQWTDAIQAENTELREALKVAQHDLFVKRELLFGAETERDALQAKLSAVEAREPVGEVAPSNDGSGIMSIKWSKSWSVRNLMFGDKLYSAPVAPAQPVNELVEALECLIATHWPLEEAITRNGCYTSDPNEIKARKALASAKAAQPLTKEQVDSVIDVLEQGRSNYSAGDGIRDDLLAQFGPRLTPEEVTECIAMSGEPCCQACGRKWKDHHKRCEGSAN
jgi:hypothetical protein